MRYLRVGPAGAETPVVYADGTYYDLSGVTPDIDGAFLAAGGLHRLRCRARGRSTSAARASAHRSPGPASCCASGRTTPPTPPSPARLPPEQPIMFYKAPNTVVGPHDDIAIPPGRTKTDWEVELGRRDRADGTLPRRHRMRRWPASPGYVVSNDVSERDFQLAVSGGQWSKGKSCETFNPLGPVARHAGRRRAADHRLRSWVNGEPRQDSSTADMIFDVAYLIWDLSQYTVLEPGDLINTGTPQGVGTVRAVPVSGRRRRGRSRDRRPRPAAQRSEGRRMKIVAVESVRHPLPDLARAGRLGRDEPGPRLLGRVRDPADRRRRRGARLHVHHRPRQRGVPGRARRAGTARARGRHRRHGRVRPAAHPRLADPLARPGEGRRAPGRGRDGQRRLGPARQGRRQAGVAAARRAEPAGDRRPGRLALPHRRAHPVGGARPAQGGRTGPGRAGGAHRAARAIRRTPRRPAGSDTPTRSWNGWPGRRSPTATRRSSSRWARISTTTSAGSHWLGRWSARTSGSPSTPTSAGMSPTRSPG